jgi:ribose/xylose/arabinose/galactoside ABC-type transport system permease subunit
MFAERFTNGPYNIQNNGDQIKVTLNISLDWFLENDIFVMEGLPKRSLLFFIVGDLYGIALRRTKLYIWTTTCWD